MIKNNICEDCWHQYVCDKLKTLSKFDDDNKAFIRVDITINKCLDYSAPDLENKSEA